MNHEKTNESLRELEQARQDIRARDFDLWNVDRVFKDRDHTYSCYWFTTEITVNIRIDKIGDVTPILKDFYALGYRQKGKMKLEKNAWGGYAWRLSRGKNAPEVLLRGSIQKGHVDGDSCRLVKVGVKLVEQDIYEIVCPEGQEVQGE